ncbi:Trypsin-like peptidase domain-containing protein [Amycolatopsis tolypomycina]|uniref:Trypsin-like peptidase domain-containing protein n=1 Tax=Amycolatopsis tolypomycina TaxID=208445 RepID=A0A1H4YAA8_9PSEU|nr:trypsin-like peptidase domain-containing protein [Amycolatopsis tolypomycina]SED14833.1 Trypsin-like peptidase domain-containing protein [Amycolatopsis tolypomycina]
MREHNGSAEGRAGDPEPWRVCLSDSSGRALGAGMLLGEATVLTCAHVVQAAGEEALSGGPVLVRFVGLTGMPEAQATVRPGCWVPQTDDGRGDIALLDLAEAFPHVPGAPLVRLGAVRDRVVHTYGFPAPHRYGVWVNNAELAGPAGAAGEWIQLNSPLPGERVRRGFSGAGVIDKATGAVLGMVVTEYTDERAGLAYLIPVEVIVRHVPDVARWVGEPPRPPAGPLIVVIGDRDSAVRQGFLAQVRRERRGSRISGERLDAIVDATGKTTGEVAEHVSAGISTGEVLTVLETNPEDVAVAVTGVEDARAPEEVLTDVVRPLVDKGATVLVQFSTPDSPGVRLARRWEIERNARRLDRLALLVEMVEHEEERTRERAARLGSPVAVPGGSADLRLRLAALRSAGERIEPGRVRRALAATERDAEAARWELVRLYGRLDALADRHDELRGRLRGYNAKATGAGLMEDEELGELYRAAMAVLTTRPAEPEAAAEPVERYVRAVRRRLEGA